MNCTVYLLDVSTICYAYLLRKQYGRVMKKPWKERSTFLVRMKTVAMVVVVRWGPTIVKM